MACRLRIELDFPARHLRILGDAFSNAAASWRSEVDLSSHLIDGTGVAGVPGSVGGLGKTVSSLVRHTYMGGEVADPVRRGAQLSRGGYLISLGFSVRVTIALLRVKIREIQAAFLQMEFPEMLSRRLRDDSNRLY